MSERYELQMATSGRERGLYVTDHLTGYLLGGPFYKASPTFKYVNDLVEHLNKSEDLRLAVLDRNDKYHEWLENPSEQSQAGYEAADRLMAQLARELGEGGGS